MRLYTNGLMTAEHPACMVRRGFGRWAGGRTPKRQGWEVVDMVKEVGTPTLA